MIYVYCTFILDDDTLIAIPGEEFKFKFDCNFLKLILEKKIKTVVLHQVNQKIQAELHIVVDKQKNLSNIFF